MKVVLASHAVSDLSHIARDNPQRALAFVAELRAAALGLTDLPLAFPLVPHCRIACSSTASSVPARTSIAFSDCAERDRVGAGPEATALGAESGG